MMRSFASSMKADSYAMVAEHGRILTGRVMFPLPLSTTA
jgi:hypothetical protein